MQTMLSKSLPVLTGTVMLAALPILLGTQLLIAFLSYDMTRLPRTPIHKTLDAVGNTARQETS